jgi:phage repressor protein C with HTH and peptisase S24 domain
LARFELAEETLERAGRLTLRVNGTSMLPSIRPGSLVEIRRAKADAVSPGDIVLLRAAPGFRLHRLVEIRPGVLVTRGDNHRHDDPPEPADRLLGVAVRIEQAA